MQEKGGGALGNDGGVEIIFSVDSSFDIFDPFVTSAECSIYLRAFGSKIWYFERAQYILEAKKRVSNKNMLKKCTWQEYSNNNIV